MPGHSEAEAQKLAATLNASSFLNQILPAEERFQYVADRSISSGHPVITIKRGDQSVGATIGAHNDPAMQALYRLKEEINKRDVPRAMEVVNVLRAREIEQQGGVNYYIGAQYNQANLPTNETVVMPVKHLTEDRKNTLYARLAQTVGAEEITRRESGTYGGETFVVAGSKNIDALINAGAIPKDVRNHAITPEILADAQTARIAGLYQARLNSLANQNPPPVNPANTTGDLGQMQGGADRPRAR